MESDDRPDNTDTTSASAPEVAPAAEPTATYQDLGDWRGKSLIDSEGKKIGKLEDVYYDVESDEPQFGTVKEGLLERHLTFVPLHGVTISPDSLQVAVTKQQVKDAPNIALEGDELTSEAESALYHHYQLNYTPVGNPRGRRLVRH